MATRARTSTGDPTLQCDQCSFSCNLRHQLDTHKISKHGVTVKSVKFNGIKRKSPPNKSPDTKKALKVNMKHEQKEHKLIKLFTCTECAFVYKSESDLKVHMSVMHAQIKQLSAGEQ